MTKSRRRILLLVVEEETEGPPSYDADTTAEELDNEVSRILTVARPTLRKCSAVVLPFVAKRAVTR